jgi:hypothetical protein
MVDTAAADNLYSKIDTFATLSSNQVLRDVVSATSVRSQIEKMWGLISNNPDMPIQLPSTENMSGMEYVKKIRTLIDGSGNAQIKQMFDASPLAALAGSRSTGSKTMVGDGDDHSSPQMNDFFKNPNIQSGFEMFKKYTSRAGGKNSSNSSNSSSSSSSSSSNTDDSSSDDSSSDDSSSDDSSNNDSSNEDSSNDDNGNDDSGNADNSKDDHSGGNGVEDNRDVFGNESAKKNMSHPLTPSDMLALGIGQNSCLVDVDTQTLQGFLKIVKAPRIPTKRGPMMRMVEDYNHPTAENLTVRALSIIDGDRSKTASLIAGVTQHTNRIIQQTKEITPEITKLFATAETTLKSDMFNPTQRAALQSCIEELQRIQRNIDQELNRVIKLEKKKSQMSTASKILTGLGITGGVALTGVLAKHMWASTTKPGDKEGIVVEEEEGKTTT